MIDSLDSLFSYLQNYSYDVIHFFNVRNEIKEQISKQIPSALFSNIDFFEKKNIQDILQFYSLNISKKGKFINKLKNH